MLYFGLDVQLRRGSVAGYTTDESWAYGPKEGVEAFESITFFIRLIYAINFEHLLIYNDMLYIVGYIFTFMVYGSNKFNSILFGTLSIAFLLFFVYNWWVVSSMPYERFLYIGLGLLVYICEFINKKAIQNDL